MPLQPGPRVADLGHDLTIDISERYAYVARNPAAKLLEKTGSIYNDKLLGCSLEPRRGATACQLAMQ